ncbi:hypothetical protein PsYK624_068450 [Phanerochaete sordida]|uniref:Uncharacterized protein n=1 Tax=Phanerochaete sordida TaxID=48140 RepID=A0A9P3LCP4_9APHY|nr:hypothetical protein PsYK624_068450 [Phanerochaete sordida]
MPRTTDDATPMDVDEERLQPWIDLLLEFSQVLDRYARERKGPGVPLPPFVYMCEDRNIRQFILYPGFEAGHLAAAPDFLEGIIDAVVTRWRITYETWTEGRARKGMELTNESADSNASQLAVAWFECSLCKRATLDHRTALVHRCDPADYEVPVPQLPAGSRSECIVQALVRLQYDWQGLPGSWPQHLAFDTRSYWRSLAVVRTCERNPWVVSHLGMDHGNARVACMLCNYVMTWRRAVDMHPGDCPWNAQLAGSGKPDKLPVDTMISLPSDPRVASLFKPIPLSFTAIGIVPVLMSPRGLDLIRAIERTPETKPPFYCTQCRTFAPERHHKLAAATVKSVKDHYVKLHGASGKSFKPVLGVHYVHRLGDKLHDMRENDPEPVSFHAMMTQFMHR